MDQALRRQIEETMRQAMNDRVSEVVCGRASREDAAWILSLVHELRDRVNALTPRRSDLHDELATHIDDTLLLQMLRNNALDATDLVPFRDVIFRRIETLCAPIQDRCVCEWKEQISNDENPAHSFAALLSGADRFLNEIDALAVNRR